MIGRKKTGSRPTAPAEGWTVWIGQATKQPPAYYTDYDASGLPIHDTLAVRLRYAGKFKFTVGTVEIADEEFEDKVTSLKAKAEERAEALTAVGAKG